MIRAVLAVAVALFVAGPVAAIEGETWAAHDHADVGLSASFGLFPQHDEVVSALRSHADHPWVSLHELGQSKRGQPILLAEIVKPSAVPIDQRVVTLILTQQHGNEPAGTPAALSLLADLLGGHALADTLDNQVLLVLPMANPDGAAEQIRFNDAGADLNRDHIGLEQPETRALHEALVRWDVHVAMDHHEYGGQGFGNPVPVRIYDYDLTTLFPVHKGVRDGTLHMAQMLMYEGIWPAAQEAGYSTNEYGEQTIAGIPYQKVAGGPDPGILRNNFGLHNIAGLLVETRIDEHPNPFHDAQRRTAIHRVVMDATLEYASMAAAKFIEVKRASEQANVENPLWQYVEGESSYRVPGLYGVPDFDGLDAIVALQGLDELDSEGQRVFPSAQLRGGLVSATFNPYSSRAVSGEVVLMDVGEESVITHVVLTPGLAGVTVLVGLIALAGLLRRR